MLSITISPKLYNPAANSVSNHRLLGREGYYTFYECVGGVEQLY